MESLKDKILNIEIDHEGDTFTIREYDLDAVEQIQKLADEHAIGFVGFIWNNTEKVDGGYQYSGEVYSTAELLEIYKSLNA